MIQGGVSQGLGAATWAALSGSESVRLTVLTPQQRGRVHGLFRVGLCPFRA